MKQGKGGLRALLGLVMLLGLALVLVACEDQATALPGPPGPPTAGPSPTVAPTETPVSVTGSGAELYNQAHAAMNTLKSYHFVTDTTLGRGATQRIEGDWAAPNKLKMTVVNKGAGTDGTQHILRIGPQQWTRKTDAEAWATTPAQTGSLSPDQTAGLLRYAASLDKTDDVTLDNQPMQHLTFTLDPAKLAGSAAGMSQGDGELWIDPANHWITQMLINYTSNVIGARGESVSTMRLSAFNAGVEINAP
jgi:hypothetical protein